MRHGYIAQEIVEYRGIDKITARWYNQSLLIASRLRVGGTSYHFDGYMTSILEKLYEFDTKYFLIEESHLVEYPSATIQLEVVSKIKGGSEAILDNIRSGIGGTMGATSVVDSFLKGGSGAAAMAQSALGGALDGKTIADRTGLTGANAKLATQSKPNRFTKLVDHMLGGRVHVKIGCHFNDNPRRAARVIDTKETSLNCTAIAGFLEA